MTTRQLLLKVLFMLVLLKNYWNHFENEKYFVDLVQHESSIGRTNPYNWQIPKIISGYDSESLEKIKQWYSEVYDTIIPVSSMRTAEMCKLYENCFRMVNIAYVNEITDACVKHKIDPIEMINASSTKPFGFMPFYPGLFVGGTCIPINPYYLKMNCELPLLDSATTMMEYRPICKALELIKKYNPEKLLVIGIAFQQGQTITDGSETFIQTLQRNNISVNYYDPCLK